MFKRKVLQIFLIIALTSVPALAFDDFGSLWQRSGTAISTGFDITGITLASEIKIDQNVETLTGNKTLVVTDKTLQKLDPGGVSRDVTLTAEASSTDLIFYIWNMGNGAGEDLVIKSDAPATIATIGPEMGVMMSCDGTTWTGVAMIPADGALIVDGVSGDVALRAAAHLLLPLHNDAATPTLAFSDGDSGLFEASDDSMRISVAGVAKWIVDTNGIRSVINFGAGILPSAATSTVPVHTFEADLDTGAGRAGADQFSLIAGGVEGHRLTESTTIQHNLQHKVLIGDMTTVPDGTLHVHTGTAGTVTANANADDLVVEGSGAAGISILVPDTTNGYLAFGNPGDSFGAAFIWNYDGDTNGTFSIGTYKANAQTIILSGDATEAARIDASQHLLVGHTASVSVAGIAPELQVSGTAVGSISANLYSETDALAPNFVLAKSGHASKGSHTIVADNELIGDIAWTPSDGVDFANVFARIRAEVDDATPAANDIGTAISLWTHPGGGGSLTKRVEITAAGTVGIGLTPTANMVGLSIEAGVVTLKETTTPTADTNYGKIYPKADNLLYFQDGAGTEHTLSISDTEYAEMYLNANGTASTIETASTPIALRQFTTGSLNDWTFDAGSTAAITVYADYSGTVAGTVLATSTHGLTTGDIISIRGTTNYNGVFEITVVDGTHFYFTDTWVADDGASDFDEPSHLIAGSNAAGTYNISWNMSSAEGGGAGSTFTFAVYKEATAHTQSRVQRKFANNDVGAFGGCGVITVAVGDWIFVTASSSGTNAITNSYGAMVLSRL